MMTQCNSLTLLSSFENTCRASGEGIRPRAVGYSLVRGAEGHIVYLEGCTMEQVAASVSLIRPRSRVRVLVRDNAPATEAGRPELPRLGNWPRTQFGKHCLHLSGPQFLTCIMGTRALPGPSQGCGDADGEQGADREQDMDLLWKRDTAPDPGLRLCSASPQGPSDLGLTWTHVSSCQRAISLPCPLPPRTLAWPLAQPCSRKAPRAHLGVLLNLPYLSWAINSSRSRLRSCSPPKSPTPMAPFSLPD